MDYSMNEDNDTMNEQKKPDKKRLPLIDKITYGPIKKYKVYNRFPWKMMLHIVLLMVVTAQIILIIDHSGGYSRSEEAFFFDRFLNEDADYNEVDFQKDRYFYSIEDLRDFVKESIDNYYGIEDSDAFEKYVIPTFTDKESGK
jgi:hypothetical protein